MDVREHIKELMNNTDINQIVTITDVLITEALEANRYEDVLIICNEMGGFFRVTGREGKASQLMDLALEMIVHLKLEGSVQHATTLVNAGTVYRVFKDYKKAFDCYEEADRIYKQLNNRYSYEVASLYNNQGLLFLDVGRNEEALTLLRESHDLIQELAPDSSTLATSEINLALTLMGLEDFTGAEDYLKKGLEIYEKMINKPGHYGSALTTAGDFAYYQGHNEQALGFWKDALDFMRSQYGDGEGVRLILERIIKVEVE